MNLHFRHSTTRRELVPDVMDVEADFCFIWENFFLLFYLRKFPSCFIWEFFSSCFIWEKSFLFYLRKIGGAEIPVYLGGKKIQKFFFLIKKFVLNFFPPFFFFSFLLRSANFCSIIASDTSFESWNVELLVFGKQRKLRITSYRLKLQTSSYTQLLYENWG